MKIRKIIRTNKAVSGVIEALLLVALVAIILSIIQIAYIPNIMEDKENEHMKEVEKQFSYLKATIDIQSMTKEKVLVSSPLTLGNSDLPFFVTMGSTGQIDVIDENNAGGCKIKILPAPTLPDFPADFVNGIPLTSIKYQSRKSYMDYDYDYIFEGGGIISQKRSEGMMVKPSMIVEGHNDYIKIYYNLPFFTSVPGKKSDSSGYADPDKTVFIRTNYSISNMDLINDATIQIYTNYPDAWNQSLIGDNGLLLEYYNNGDIDVTRDDSQTPAMIEIKGIGSFTIDIELTLVKIGVQIVPGIIRS